MLWTVTRDTIQKVSAICPDVQRRKLGVFIGEQQRNSEMLHSWRPGVCKVLNQLRNPRRCVAENQTFRRLRSNTSDYFPPGLPHGVHRAATLQNTFGLARHPRLRLKFISWGLLYRNILWTVRFLDPVAAAEDWTLEQDLACCRTH